MRLVGFGVVLLAVVLLIYGLVRTIAWLSKTEDSGRPTDRWEPVFDTDGVMCIWHLQLGHTHKRILIASFSENDEDFNERYMAEYWKANQRAEILNLVREKNS